MGLYIVPAPARRASDAAAGGVTPPGTWDMCGHVPPYLPGGWGCLQHVLDKATPPGHLGLGGRSCWSPAGSRELGYLSISSVEEQLVWLPYAHSAQGGHWRGGNAFGSWASWEVAWSISLSWTPVAVLLLQEGLQEGWKPSNCSCFPETLEIRVLGVCITSRVSCLFHVMLWWQSWSLSHFNFQEHDVCGYTYCAQRFHCQIRDV